MFIIFILIVYLLIFFQINVSFYVPVLPWLQQSVTFATLSPALRLSEKAQAPHDVLESQSVRVTAQSLMKPETYKVLVASKVNSRIIVDEGGSGRRYERVASDERDSAKRDKSSSLVQKSTQLGCSEPAVVLRVTFFRS